MGHAARRRRSLSLARARPAALGALPVARGCPVGAVPARSQLSRPEDDREWNTRVVREGEDLDRLLRTYWRCQRLAHSERREDREHAKRLWWAWEEVDEAVSDPAPDVVVLLVALAEAAPSDRDAGNLGAGPLWNLMRLHGEAVLDEVDEAGRNHRRFRIAIGGAHSYSSWPDAVEGRLRPLVDPPLVTW